MARLAGRRGPMTPAKNESAIDDDSASVPTSRQRLATDAWTVLVDNRVRATIQPGTVVQSRITDPHGEFLILAGNTDMHQSFNQRVHFYYCVLVALKMHGKSKKAGGIRGKNNFLLKWLRRAQDNNIFPPDITSEIEWLRGKIIQAGYDTDLEPMLDFVYATASRAEALKNAE